MCLNSVTLSLLMPQISYLFFATKRICSGWFLHFYMNLIVFEASLTFGIKSYFKFILHTFWARPEISHFSQEALVLFRKKLFLEQQSGHYGYSLISIGFIIVSRPFQWTELEKENFKIKLIMSSYWYLPFKGRSKDSYCFLLNFINLTSVSPFSYTEKS